MCEDSGRMQLQPGGTYLECRQPRSWGTRLPISRLKVFNMEKGSQCALKVTERAKRKEVHTAFTPRV